jgi:uncharacterized membrane-anchored protein
MKTTLSLLIFAILVPIQLFIPASMILGQETALAKGTEYKLRSRPVDPYDAFRGRYVRLYLDHPEFKLSAPRPLTERLNAYALLDRDAEGFGIIKDVVFEKPEGTNYLKIHIGPAYRHGSQVTWPFDRYYMEESKAPRAERIHQSRNNDAKAHITVRIYKGTGVITGLYVDDIPIEEKLKQAELADTPDS